MLPVESRHPSRLSRRAFPSAAGSTLVATLQAPKKRVAAIVTEYREQSHADVIIGRLFDGYAPNGQRVEPRSQIVSMFTDQIAVKDMSRPLSRQYGFPIFPTIREAMTLGGDDLAVDAVLFVGEHGRYPFNSRGQKLYPRHRIIKRIAEVFRETGASVPVFCDKHLSYSWRQAKEMHDWSRELGFPSWRVHLPAQPVNATPELSPLTGVSEHRDGTHHPKPQLRRRNFLYFNRTQRHVLCPHRYPFSFLGLHFTFPSRKGVASTY